MSDAVPIPPIVSLDEMAGILGISLPTMRARAKLDGFPAIRRGTNGVPWQLSPDDVIAFLAEQDRQAQEADAARAEAIAQYAFPMAEAAPDAASGLLSPADRLKTAQAAIKEDELARQRGFLVLTTDMRARLTEAWGPLTAFLNTLPVTLARRHNLPDAAVRDMRGFIATQQRALVERLKALAPDGALVEPEADDLAA